MMNQKAEQSQVEKKKKKKKAQSGLTLQKNMLQTTRSRIFYT
jgi:hypothetical protein